MSVPEFVRDVHFTRLIHGDLENVDLSTVALEIARDEYPDLSVDAWHKRLDRLGQQLQHRLSAGTRPEQVVREINRLLFMEQGFRGNREQYYDPQNSFLNRVLDRKLGIPITLSLVYLAVSKWAGLRLGGVCTPGHFLIKCLEPGCEFFVDPFHEGAVLDRDGCELRVSQVTGFRVTLAPNQLEAAPSTPIVLRLLGNLKAIYIQCRDGCRALRVQERIAALDLVPAQLRDLGELYLRVGRPGSAIEHLERYCEMVPEGGDIQTVEQLLREAHRLQMILN